MSEVIAITKSKGGVGKTMTSVSLSACLALNNKKVLLLVRSTRTFNKSIWIL
ncbi:AAA family ATPase [Faecalibacillus intestinalis]|uniref:AAA family ATPase n=1 Tax=Faecalibacillus intestinalis TaxID=1982626 RepID=UPI0039944604